MAINERLGSYFFIGYVVTDCEFEEDSENNSKCAGCGKCISACPLGALGDSFCEEKCLSYITQKKGELSEEEKGEFLADLGVEKSGLEKLIVASYKVLGLMSFLTTGEDETRAWTIPVGCKAPQAAGKIHTDFERGFIKAETINYKQLLESGSYAAAREKGLVRIEGKEYVMQDGDVVLFRFNV
jgi:ribosome-binding ATPase YchF (GTP1/OBG family)